jgi:hypothetical protein
MNSWLNQKGMDPVEVGDEGYRYFNYDVYVTGPVVIYNKIMAIKKDAANPDPDYASGNYGIAVDLSTGQAEYSPVNYP